MASLGSFKKGIVYTKGGLGQTGIALPSGAAPAATYLLDIYSGASAAYSVRKLSSTTTNSMRVRRSSDNSEQDIGFVGSDLDTASLLSFVGANYGFVVTLYDQSGNGNDATNASAASQPQVVSSGVVITENGVTNLNFLSNSHRLRSSSASEFTGVTKFSGFNVGSFNTLNVGNQYISGVLINTNRGFKLGTEASSDSMRFHYNPSSFGVMNGGTLIANQQQLIAGLYDTNVGNAYINGTSVGSVSVTITANTPNYYFIGYSFTAIGGAKKMQEAIFYPSYENANRADIEANINAYYSIYTALDSDAQAYITAAGITNPTEQAAVNQLVLDLKGTGSTTNNTDVWSDSYTIYPLSPTSLAAAAFNLKDPTQNITWFNSPTHSTSGVSGNGTTMYGDTGINILNDIGSNNFGMYVRVDSQNANNQAEMGAIKTSSPFDGGQVVPYFSNLDSSFVGGVSNDPLQTSRTGLLGVQKNSSNVDRSLDGVIYGSEVNALGTAQNISVFVLARALGTSPNLYTTKTHSFYAITAGGLTSNQIADLHYAQNKYNTTLAR